MDRSPPAGGSVLKNITAEWLVTGKEVQRQEKKSDKVALGGPFT